MDEVRFRAYLQGLSPEDQDRMFLLYYAAFIANRDTGFVKNAINQLKCSNEVANICEFSLQRVFELQDLAEQQDKDARDFLDSVPED